MNVMKYDVSKIAGEVIEVLAKYAVPASVRDHVFECVRSSYDFKAEPPKGRKTIVSVEQREDSCCKPVKFSGIRQERDRRGWSQSFVAEQVGITKAAYCNIETGQRKPSYDVLIKLLALFDYSDPRRLFEKR